MTRRRIGRAVARAGLGITLAAALSGWSQQQQLLASDGAANDSLGLSVSVSGDTALVGAPGKNYRTGAAYVFVRSGTTWSQQATLLASDGAKDDAFGWSVSLSGDTAVVGAYGKNRSTGAAYVFVRSGATWFQQATLLASDGAAGDTFGCSVSVSGDTTVVGAAWSSDTGAAYVFVRSGTTWTQQATLMASDGAAGDSFGCSVSIAQDTAVVGTDSSFTAGAAYVFVRGGTTWSQQATLLASDCAQGDSFGWWVSVTGDTAVVSAPSKNLTAGAAYVFVRSGATWSQPATLLGSDCAVLARFGYSVSVSGDTAVVGAYGQNSATGAVYIFTVDSGVGQRDGGVAPGSHAGCGCRASGHLAPSGLTVLALGFALMRPRRRRRK